jgi:hypothetical protein
MQDIEAVNRQYLIEMIEQSERDIAAGRFVDYEADQIGQLLIEAGW